MSAGRPVDVACRRTERLIFWQRRCPLRRCGLEEGRAGLPKNDAEAVVGIMYVLYLMDAETGAVTTAGFGLSRRYANGEGFPRDNVQAYAQFLIVEARSTFITLELLSTKPGLRTTGSLSRSPCLLARYPPRKTLRRNGDKSYELYYQPEASRHAPRRRDTTRCRFVDDPNEIAGWQQDQWGWSE